MVGSRWHKTEFQWVVFHIWELCNRSITWWWCSKPQTSEWIESTAMTTVNEMLIWSLERMEQAIRSMFVDVRSYRRSRFTGRLWQPYNTGSDYNFIKRIAVFKQVFVKRQQGRLTGDVEKIIKTFNFKNSESYTRIPCISVLHIMRICSKGQQFWPTFKATANTIFFMFSELKLSLLGTRLISSTAANLNPRKGLKWLPERAYKK